MLLTRKISMVFAIGVWATAFLPPASEAQNRRTLEDQIPKLVANRSLRALGRYPGSARMDVAIGLPLGDKQGLKAFIDALYDPTAPGYKNYLTPDQFTARFGAAAADYQKVVDFVKSRGLTVTATTPNRMIVDVSGSVSDFERVFHFTMRTYQHPAEPRSFHAPDIEPSVPVEIPILDIMGLDDYMPPRRMDAKPPRPGTEHAEITGSGPGGGFQSKDLRAAYAPGVTLTGAGQSIGLLETGPYSPDDIIAYEQASGLPIVPVMNVLSNGVNGIWTPGYNDDEEALDIEMAIAMAPGAQILVYEGTLFADIMNRMATDNAARQLSSSWAVNASPPTLATIEQILMEYTVQGQTFFVASFDDGAYAPSSSIAAPVGDPYITSVGGTALVTTGPGGAWLSETVWTGSGGGVDSAYPIPSWQAGVSMITNMGSTTFRNIPDVAIVASPSLFWVKNGQTTATGGGTSAATPLWAGFLALVNQQAAENQKPPVGFLNPTLYALGQGAHYSSDFHDITVGNNTNAASPNLYYAVPGYDLTTGWGTPTGQNLINDLIGGSSGTPGFSLSVAPYQIDVNPGSSAGGKIIVNPYGGFTGSVGLSISGLPSGVVASFSPSSTVSNSTLTLTVPGSAAAGSYVGTITASSGALKQTIAVNLIVIAPITPDFTISASPSLLNVTPGASVRTVIGIAPVGTFASAVALSEFGAPSGVVASFSPASTASSSTLTLTASSQVTPGIYIISISASSGDLNRVSTIGLLVRASALTPVPVDLSTNYNVTGIAADGAPFLTGIADCCGYSANLLGPSLTVGQAVPFIFGPITNGIAPPWNTINDGGVPTTVPLPSGQFGSLQMLASAYSNQEALDFQVNYSDGTSTTFKQSVSDWNTPQNYSGETTALSMPYYNQNTGAKVTTTANLYGYGFNLDKCKTVASFILPKTAGVDLLGVAALALTLVPPSTPCSANPAFFNGEDSLGSGVYYLQFPDNNLFGYYNYPSSSILYHYDMGFEAFIAGSASDIYLYDFTSSHWWYTSSTLFPYLYDFTLNAWLYYFPDTANPGHYTTNPRYFSNLTTGKIIQM
jgi:subtilase family serine protease